jgi:type IV pilus assembly protein PilX
MKKQSGVTLLIGLMLLVMLSLIGVIGYRNTTMSERMAGNTQDRNISFQSAESAAKEALTVIEANNFSAATLGHYSPPLLLGGNSNFWTQGGGTAVTVANCRTATSFGWANCSVPVSAKYANNANTPTYVIELIATATSSVSSSGSTSSPSVTASITPTATITERTYRVTARSDGGSGSAESIVQVLYSRRTSP